MEHTTRILLVEDNRKDAALVKTILTEKGHDLELDVAVSGEHALEKMKASLPDLVLLDYNLPGMNGLAVLEHIHRNEWRLPVVMLTGVGDELIAAEAIKQGADDYIVKDDKLLFTLVPLIRRFQREGKHAHKSSEMFLPREIHLLYVEDNIRDAEDVQRHFLRYSPHIHITWIANPREILEFLKSGVLIDCALLDLRLLGTDAIELMKEIENAGYKVPFVVVTGKGSEEAAVATMKQGAYDYIAKRDDYVSKLPYAIEMAVMKFRRDRMNQQLQRELAELNATLEQKVQERTAMLTAEIAERKRAEEVIRESENRYRSLFENMLEGYAFCKMLFDNDKPEDFIYLNVNRAFEQLTGLRDVVGRKVTEVIPGIKESNPELFEIYGRVALTGKPEKFETYVEPLGIWFSVAVYGPRKEHFIAVFDNITERKQVEQALQEHEQQLSSIYDTVGDVIYHLAVEKDERYRFISVNQAFVTTTGIDSAQVVGKLVNEIIPEPSLTLVLGKYQEAIREKKIVRWEETSDYPTGKLTGEVSVAPVFDATGNCTHLVGAVHDITQRKRAEEAIQENEEQFRSIFEQARVGMAQVAPDGRWLRLNQRLCDIVGYTRNELLTKSFQDITHPDDVKTDVASLRRMLTNEIQTYTREKRYVRKDGSIVWVNLTTSLVRGQTDAPKYFVTIVEDISKRKLAEEALRQSEERYRDLVENINDGYYVADSNGRIIYASPNVFSWTGYSKKELIGLSYVRLIAHEDRRKVVAHYTARAQDGTIDTLVEFRVRPKNGTVFWIEQTTRITRDSDGKAFQYKNIVRNITERKIMEEKLQLSDQILRKVGSLVLVANENGGIEYASPSFHNVLGYEPSELLGDKWWEVSRVIPSDAYKEKEYTKHAAKDDGYTKTAPYERLVKDKNGKKRWILWQDARGARNTLIGVGHDITELKQAEKALRQSEERYRTLAEAAHDIIFIVDKDDRVQYINEFATQLLGGSPEEFMGKHLTKVFPPEVAERHRQFNKKVFSTAESVYEESLLPFPTGNVWLGTRLAPIKNEKGEVIAIMGISRDISEGKRGEEERRSLESQLQQAQKLESLGTLASGIAHDFNNILGIILGHSSLLERVEADPAKRSQSLEAIQKATGRGASLVKQLLTFARKTESVRESIRVNEIIKEIVKLINETFPKTVIVMTELKKDLPSVIADASQLHQVVLNLCVNARDAMPKGGTLTISTTTIGGEAISSMYPKATAREYVLLQVADTGTGMDETTKRRIFEPFFTTKEIGKGTGLGLALVYGIIGNHGGFIDVASQLGKGTTFSIYLPIPERSIESQRVSRKVVQDIPGGTEGILLIEDEEMLREMVRAILVSKGYTVFIAQDGVEGVDMFSLHQEEISAVISDVGLPRFGGEEVFRQIQAINPKAKVILASGFIDPNIKSELLKGGAKSFIQKPYSLDEVLKTIRDVLDQKE